MNPLTGDSTVILVVEDSEDDAWLIRRGFEQLRSPSRLQLAKDGEEAIAYLSGAGMYAERKRFPMPDLVLLDLKMPGRDGFEVLEWIRSRGELGGLPVIVMTTSDGVKDVNRAYAAGANSFLVKPTEVENFMGLLRAMNAFWLQQARRPKVTAQRVGEDARLESGASLNV